ncbi:MAG TPA: dTDP-glucose 4,6-dehydratase [Candidatus Krumholzibacteria bacterium]|nr:dTDP-glucose 4,6-dehydratase [Candidatus Krumholzibacteria bacterium]HPD71212.1 dTDP-glucose 4,6-dehydratase [Candidatus Krumholzibacteria bacterium]HRY39088.1 dTDP-glucose 4,6-dehydratase [Candidatus Krumholzibacteria bacterium]
MNILVTGGAGFIGSNHIRHLLATTGDRIVNLDLLTYAGNLENLAGLEDHPRYRFVRGDIRDGELVGRVLAEERIDAVVHFAAESHVDRSLEAPGVFLDTNTRGTQVLLDLASRHRLARFVMVSTDEVYGSLAPESPGFSESSPLAPNSPYAASKAAADLVCRAYHRTFGLDVCITRCSNNYGPFQFPEKLIPLMIANALEDRPLPVYGDGLNVRDWLHVEDHCRAIDLVMRKGRSGEVYNIGGGNEWSNLALVKLLLAELGKPESLIEFVPDRPGHDRRYAIVADKIRGELGWRPLRPFAEGIRSTVAWYLANRSWWEKIRSGAYRDYYARFYGPGGRYERG